MEKRHHKQEPKFMYTKKLANVKQSYPTIQATWAFFLTNHSFPNYGVLHHLFVIPWYCVNIVLA
jgi:hypothetical protein